MRPKIPAKFVHVGFIDLVCDSIFHYRQSKDMTDPYTVNRNARASILSSALSLECLANALLKDFDASSACLNDLDKLSPLSKIELYFRLNSVSESIKHGDNIIQKIKELIQVRNSFVHTKSKSIKTTIDFPEDGGTHWIVPMELDGDFYSSLKIPKSPMFWDDNHAREVLSAALAFHKIIFYLLESIKKGDYMLTNHVVLNNIIMPSIFSEFDSEIEYASKIGLDVNFLRFD